jgi:predicted nuclease of predicted toxin-antitoxin system
VKIVADENIDNKLIGLLRESTFEVVSIREREPSTKDTHVLFLANLNNALLITEDKDFGDLVFAKRQAHFGVLLIRLQGLSRDRQISNVIDLIITRKESLLHSFSVLTPAGLRIRSSKEANDG